MSGIEDIINSGLLKVMSIVDGNVNYDYILGKRLHNSEYTAISNGLGLIEAVRANEFLQKKVGTAKVTRFLCPEQLVSNDFFCFGGTENNKKEFLFLERKAREFGFNVRLINIKECRAEKTVFDNGALKIIIEKIFRDFFFSRSVVSKSVLHQGVAYALSILGAYQTLSHFVGKLFFVSNDHSPEPVAYAKIASYFGARVVYIQHAEVTEIFPAIDFDYSILRNRVSFDVYARKGINGEVAYSSRDNSFLSAVEILEARKELINAKCLNVVVYPSSVFKKDEFSHLFTLLDKNPFIEKVFVKPHPAYKDQGFFAQLGVSVLDERFPKKHIAICGNSSVAIELVRAGNLVFNYFRLDDIAPDYYGFAAKKITNKFDITQANVCFWSCISEGDALTFLGDYFPEISTLENRLEFYKLKEIFCSMFASNSLEERKSIWLERDLFVFTSTFLRLLRDKKSDPYGNLFVVQTLNRLFDLRDVRLSTLYKCAELDSCSSVLEFWLSTKVIEWNGRIPTSMQLRVLIDFLLKGEFDKKVRNWLSVKCFDVILRFGSASDIRYFFASGGAPDVRKLGVNKKIAFLNFLNSNKANLTGLAEIYDVDADRSLTALDRLKIFVQSGLRVSDLPDCSDFKKVEQLFIEYHPKIREEYLRYVSGPYSKINERARFIDVKRNPGQEGELIGLIKERLLAKIGFSFIRLSDGEGFIFHRLNDIFTLDDVKNRQRHWWGEEIDSSVIDELLDVLFAAVKGSDLLGIPSVYRFVRDHSDKTHALSQSLQGRGLLSVLDGIRYIDTPNKLYTDDKANIAVFNKIDVISDLARSAQKIVVINSGSREAAWKAFGDHFDFAHIKIPTHNKTSLNDKYHTASKPLPYVYKDALREIENHVIPGALVLVGAGVAGKVFMHAAKAKDAVALDLGSAMDQFLGGGIQSLY